MARQYGQPKDSDLLDPKKMRKDKEPEVKEEDPSPSSLVVDRFHKNAAVDTRAEDIHHTIGTNPDQAASGSHTHNGGDSSLLIEGFTISGSKSNPATVLPSIINILTRLGAEDTTTA